jgi:E3 ubiquitin-protein ligase makorin
MQVKDKDLCYYFNKNGYCVKGDLCHFKHIKKESKKDIKTNIINSTLPIYKPVVIPKPLTSINNDKLFGDELLENLWDFNHLINDDNNNNKKNKTYKSIFAEHEIEIDFIKPNIKNISLKPIKICSYYRSGYCTFGDKCRYLHDDCNIDDIKDEPLDIECGICLGKPDPTKGGQYGLLSGCNCVFCLKCIRGWRKDGRDISTNDNVRKCPLCRNESFFTCPSIKYYTGLRKENLIFNYKQSLSTTICKNYEKNGDCSFGSSCFYKHGDNDDKMKPKFRLNGNEEASVEKEIILSDLFNLNI